MNIDEMQAGREMDALVAEKVISISVQPFGNSEFGGYCLKKENGDLYYYNGDCPIRFSVEEAQKLYPHYSTDIAAAWEVVEMLGKHGYTAHIEWKGSNRVYAATAEVTFVKCIYTEGHGVGALPEAICRAAFKAVMGRD